MGRGPARRRAGDAAIVAVTVGGAYTLESEVAPAGDLITGTRSLHLLIWWGLVVVAVTRTASVVLWSLEVPQCGTVAVTVSVALPVTALVTASVPLALAMPEMAVPVLSGKFIQESGLQDFRFKLKLKPRRLRSSPRSGCY